MIAFLTGNKIAEGNSFVVLDVSGVGYKVFCPTSVQALDSPLSLWVHTVVREDAIELYGFQREVEQQVFEALLSVSGVGPRTALAVLSAMTVRDVASATRDESGGRLNTVSGIGKKTAQRIAIDLADKLSAIIEQSGDIELLPEAPAIDEATDALLSLGYNRSEARRLAAEAQKKLPASATSEMIIREALTLVNTKS